MTLYSRVLLPVSVLLLGQCGGGTTARGKHKPEPVAVQETATEPVEQPAHHEEPTTPVAQADNPPEANVPPSMPIRQVLGMSRQMVETLFSPQEPEDPDGWVRYNDHLLMRYENDAVVEILQQVPAGLTCIEAARWMGFAEAMAPLYKSKSCVWPADSIKHLLGEGYAGYLDLATGGFTATLTVQRP